MRPEYTFAWTPPRGSYISAIGLAHAPGEPLAWQQYRVALMDRIDRMVAATPRNRAVKLLRIAYYREGLDIDDRPMSAGELLVEKSDALLEHCPFPLEPVPVVELIHEPTTLNRLIKRPMGLAAFLNRVYPPVTCW